MLASGDRVEEGEAAVEIDASSEVNIVGLIVVVWVGRVDRLASLVLVLE